MSEGEAVLLVVHLAATAAMCGLIWFVQVVHYPLFAGVGVDGFIADEQRHQHAETATTPPSPPASCARTGSAPPAGPSETWWQPRCS